jgi:hypothetical protein
MQKQKKMSYLLPIFCAIFEMFKSPKTNWISSWCTSNKSHVVPIQSLRCFPHFIFELRGALKLKKIVNIMSTIINLKNHNWNYFICEPSKFFTVARLADLRVICFKFVLFGDRRVTFPSH